jgi:hypothetical protein
VAVGGAREGADGAADCEEDEEERGVWLCNDDCAETTDGFCVVDEDGPGWTGVGALAAAVFLGDPPADGASLRGAGGGTASGGGGGEEDRGDPISLSESSELSSSASMSISKRS